MREILRDSRCLPARAICLLAAGIAIAVACNGPIYMGTLYEDRNTGEEQQPPDGNGDEQPEIPEQKVRELYVTGLEFPGGYPWKPEIGSGSGQAVLFLMKEGERIVGIPTGEAHHVSIDADMHWCVDGHLLTAYYADGRTFIKKDGKELLEYEGQERIYGIIYDNERLYTLGRTGNGFIFRCDGQNILEKQNAETMPQGIYRDNGSIIFAYREKVRVGSSDIYRYYYVSDGIPQTVSYGSDITGIYDIRIAGGKLHYTAKTADLRSFVYFADNKAAKVAASELSAPAVLMYDGKDMFIHAELKSASPHSTFWRGTKWIENSPGNHYTLSAKVTDGNIYYVHAPTGTISQLNISCFGAENPGAVPQGHELLFKECFDAVPGKYCIALNSAEDLTPVIIENGFEETYDFNGFFTGVYYQ